MSKTILDHTYGQYPGHAQAYLSEFFAFFAKLKSDEARVLALREFLQEIGNTRLKVDGVRMFMECMFLPSCKMQLEVGLPKDIPQLHKLPDKVPGSMFKIFNTIGYFLKGTQLFIPNQLRREKVFLSLFETMHEGDAFLFAAMKDQDISFIPGLSQAIVHQAYPGWIPAPSALKVQTAKDEVKQVLTESKTAPTQPVKRAPGRPRKNPLV